jgi:hypothetical protein
MEIHSSLDWSDVSSRLRQIGNRATNRPGLSRILANIGDNVKLLGNMEVEFRRTRRVSSVQYQELLTKVNTDIQELEMILMMAALCK